jgi:coenzyme F420 hydrogenase subunit beta
MYSPDARLIPLLPFALAALGLFLIGGLAYWALSIRSRLLQREQELATIKGELRERSAALAEAEGEVERLKRIPKAELLPMLKLAHEQRSPLAAIQNALDMILQGYAASDPTLQDEMLTLARERAATMLERVNDFLRLGSVRHAEIERKVQAVQLLDIVQSLAPEKRVRARWKAVDFLVDVPDHLPTVTATYEDMEHLLSNLINNAIKYTDPGGKVTLSLREENGSVVGTVADTGVGISPRDLPRIFDEFYRSDNAKDKADGTGLGLAIVKRVVDLYDGHLDVQSEPGRGSQFTFTFPKGEAREEEAATKTFRDLQQEVVRQNICGRCGGCTSFCSAGRLNALELDEDGVPRYADEEKCLRCGICYLICPLTTDLDAEIRRRHKWRLPIGAYHSITLARTTGGIMPASTAGDGVILSLLRYMMDNYVIQAAVVPQETTAFDRQPLIATSIEALVSSASSRADHADLGQRDRYTTYAPLLRAIKSLGDSDLNCVSLVGSPCQIRTIRKAQCLGIFPSHVVGYTIGQFCMGHLAFDEAGREQLEERLGVDLCDVGALNVEGELNVSLHDGRVLRVPDLDLEGTMRPACLICTEFANDYADISVGGLGVPNGYSTVLVRSEKGSRVYNGALSQGYIEESESVESTELRSERTKMLASVVAMARRKRERGERWIAKLGVDDQIQSTPT